MPKTEVLTNPDGNKWYEILLDECRSLKIEAQTAAKWTIICAYHQIGAALNSYKEEFGRKGIYGEEISKRVGKAIGMNVQYVYDAQRFAERFPDLATFPGDKSVSWNQIRLKYILSPKEKDKESKKHKTCPKCGYEF